jgi:hypothetical protein
MSKCDGQLADGRHLIDGPHSNFEVLRSVVTRIVVNHKSELCEGQLAEANFALCHRIKLSGSETVHRLPMFVLALQNGLG